MLFDSIARLPEVAFSEGEEIITMGTQPGKLYFLKSGKVEVTRDGVRLSLIKTPGSVFGEMSMLLSSAATATVVATEDSILQVADDPAGFLSENPEVNLHVSKLLAVRLEAATQYLVDVKDQLQECSDHVGMVDGVLDAILHRDLKKRVAN